MGMLKIKVVDAAGAPLLGQTVKVTGAGALQTNAEGMTQFLIDNDVPIDIEINGKSCWAGSSTQLSREEQFKAAGASFARVNAGK